MKLWERGIGDAGKRRGDVGARKTEVAVGTYPYLFGIVPIKLET